MSFPHFLITSDEIVSFSPINCGLTPHFRLLLSNKSSSTSIKLTIPKQETMKKGQTVGESHNDLGENIACSLTLRGNAHHWGKYTLIFAGKYHLKNRPPSSFIHQYLVNWHALGRAKRS